MAKFQVGDRVRISKTCELSLTMAQWIEIGGLNAIHMVEKLTSCPIDDIDDHYTPDLLGVPYIFAEWELDLVERIDYRQIAITARDATEEFFKKY